MFGKLLFTTAALLSLGTIIAQKLYEKECKIIQTVAQNNSHAFAFQDKALNIKGGILYPQGIEEVGAAIGVAFEDLFKRMALLIYRLINP